MTELSFGFRQPTFDHVAIIDRQEFFNDFSVLIQDSGVTSYADGTGVDFFQKFFRSDCLFRVFNHRSMNFKHLIVKKLSGGILAL